jgi:phage terminase large subunit-like protein
MQAEKANRLIRKVTPRPYEGDDVTEFIQREMVIPETGKPMVLHEEQSAVLHAMSHKSDGENFDYSLWLYSAPKKSGKTTIGAAVALWQALQVPDGQIYIIGNDQKQSDNRMMEAIRYSINHNPRLSAHARIVRYTIYLDNGTKIESIPVDPKGEAGMNPSGLFWTEVWGAMGTRPEMLWSEAALSPTRVGKAFKFVESYAGFIGQSLILERLYNSVIKEGLPHATIPELFTSGASIGYWRTRPIMSWQLDNPDYYAQEAGQLTPSEFARMHRNQWSMSSESFIPVDWWDSCNVGTLDDLAGRGVIIGIDAAVENDCFAIVVVSSSKEGKPQVRYCNIWTPPKGGQINFADIETELLRLFKQYNVTEVCFDPYQMQSMYQRLSDNVFWKPFTQGAPRLVADKMLYDLIRDRRIEHDGSYPELRQHIINSDRKPDGDNLRIIKRNQTGKIDSVIALSMAVNRAMYYNI